MSLGSDSILIQQIRQGHPQAWGQLIARYEGRLIAFANQRLRDRASSEDVVQETFIGFLNSLPNFDDKRELQTYLFTIASHKVTDFLRKKLRHQMQIGGENADELMTNKFDDNQPRASSVARTNERIDLEHQAVCRTLGSMIRTWKEKGDFQRIQVLELLFVKGWPNRDIAKYLQVSEQQVANIRFASLKKLHEHVKSSGLPGDVFPELLEEGVAE